MARAPRPPPSDADVLLDVRSDRARALAARIRARPTRVGMDDVREAILALEEDPDLAARVLGMRAFDPAASISGPEALYRFFVRLLAGHPEERFLVVALDNKVRPLAHVVSSIGGIGFTVVDAPAIWRWALTAGPSVPKFIAVAHNHPSDDPEPSEEDLRITRVLVDQGRLLGVEVIDHLIIARRGQAYTSLAARGELQRGRR